jgi:hypothetical protein
MDWFDKKPGQPGIARLNDGAVATLLPVSVVPTVVRLPPSLGGTVSRIVSTDTIDCPECGNPHNRWHLDHEVNDGQHVTVVECPTFGQYFWRTGV